MEASKTCCPPGEAANKSCCKCAPGWTCVIKKVEDPEAVATHFYNCAEGCVCVTDDEAREVQGEGGYCVCAEGYTCTFTKTEGPEAGKVVLECGNGCRCVVSGSGEEVVVLKE